MAGGYDETELASRWEQWVSARNLRGLKIISVLAIFLYPVFWLLDYFSAPQHLFWTLGAIRLFVCVSAGVMLFIGTRRWAVRRHSILAAITTFILAFSILAMVAVLGGPRSPYYAGINLVLIGSGLLFLWPLRSTLAVYGLVVLSWLVLVAVQGLTEALNNTLFLLATAVLVIVGQMFSYRTYSDQVGANLALELTKSSLEQAHEELKKLDRFKSQFFANITHELKTPLTLILSPIELLLQGQTGPLGDSQKATLNSMYRSGMKLLKLVGDLLDLSKLQESRVRLQIAENEMVAYLAGLVAQVQPMAQRKEIVLTFVADLPESKVWCDLERMERVFINLLSNAVKFTPQGGAVDVRFTDLGPSIRVSVKDNGPGFAGDQAEKVFERFYQVDMGGTRQYGGTGIGLALARELVELHGGRIWAEAEQGKGATFTVELTKDREHFDPRALDRRQGRKDVHDGKRAADESLEDWSVQMAKSQDYRLLDIAEVTDRRAHERDVDEHEKAYTVLIVEDTPDIIRFVHLTLRHQFRVIAAPDGLKGLELAQKEQPNLVVTDLMMPGIDGLELTRRLRADPKLKGVPIIMLTARADLDDRVVGLETGVNAYVAKPFSARELLTTVRGLLNIQETTADLLMAGKMSSLEVLAGGMAHEINNPLNFVKNAFSKLEDDARELRGLVQATLDGDEGAGARFQKLDVRMKKMFQVAELGIRRIGGTVDLMRKYSREGFDHDRQLYDAWEAVRHVLELVVPAREREVEVDVELDGAAPVVCTPEELHQALTNLIENAIDAVPEDRQPKLTIRGRQDGDFVVLTIADNGEGISREHLERIFTPFFTTKAPGRGLGLGLTIVWRVIQSLGGTVNVQSQPGVGTEFSLRMPCLGEGAVAVTTVAA